MKLLNIYIAKEAWQRLGSLKMPPHTAYRLLKYIKQVTVEGEIIESQRIKLVYSSAGANEGEPVNLEQGTPQHLRFVADFTNTLETESDLKPFSMTLPGLLDLLGKEQGNTLSAQDLSLLEPFFEEVNK